MKYSNICSEALQLFFPFCCREERIIAKKEIQSSASAAFVGQSLKGRKKEV